MAGNTTARGYGYTHQRLRADYQARMDAGEQFMCWRCGLPILKGFPWHLGHDDLDRTLYRGPEHRGKECPRGGNCATYRRPRAPKPAGRWLL